jgi:hypothetical protein
MDFKEIRVKFDKNKIKTAVTADEVKVGDRGWFADNLVSLQKKVEGGSLFLNTVNRIREIHYTKRFRADNDEASLFYPYEEAAYEKLQEEWVKENNIKVGSKVKIVRTVDKTGEYNWYPFEFDKEEVGEIFEIRSISKNEIELERSKSPAYPFFVLKPVKTETYAKKASEIMKWMEENNYTVTEMGVWRPSNWEKGWHVFFFPDMWQSCGKVVSTNWWRSEWVEEREV